MTKETKVNFFDGPRDDLRDAIAYERGHKVDLHVTEVPAPPKAVSPNDIRRPFHWEARG
jgi:hypothetical protein